MSCLLTEPPPHGPTAQQVGLPALEMQELLLWNSDETAAPKVNTAIVMTTTIPAKSKPYSAADAPSSEAQCLMKGSVSFSSWLVRQRCRCLSY